MSTLVHTAAVLGIEAFPVVVEADVANGLPNFFMVGLPDAAVRESRERIRAAITHSGFVFPHTRITVNLAPAEMRKEGPGFDLAIALAVLAAVGLVDEARLEKVMMLGELGLSGDIRPVRGALPVALLANRMGKELVVQTSNATEVAVVPEVKVRAVSNLRQVVDWLNGKVDIPLETRKPINKVVLPTALVDFSTIRGHQTAKRALEIAAAGGHNLRMIGPPGSGKTLLARSLLGILPPLSDEEALDVAVMASVVGKAVMNGQSGLTRPFRAPHHSASTSSMVGGGSVPMPGEISLAHRGVLFLDELPEFSRLTLEALRQPMEDGQLTVARSRFRITFPCRSIVVAAHNPCPCGYFGDEHCRCSTAIVEAYQSRISGPLLDRFDLHIEVPRLPFGELFSDDEAESSLQVLERVRTARQRQMSRFTGSKFITNADLDAEGIRRFIGLSQAAVQTLKLTTEKLRLSTRAYAKVIKVGRTIADLAGAHEIEPMHIAEAIRYR